ncbi:sporulation related protein [Pseudoduganella flava]|uniref:SPOR domain-containing protein n=1 Tax=Pseudoduganella flava TaxID=871742 RepID=A0A562Q2Y2_9BURK|nr:SPOR domain-containing protein [Pseudoduganella flava]QGZ41129.1 SPOR domain-containing protein [Pseudoduganella flava]TWI51055.1 sporulation related protein [Pseudoduganella flava]
MLKFSFFLLLAANAVVFAVGQGYVGNLADGEREPARLNKQLNAQYLKVIPAAQATAAAAAAAPPPPAPKDEAVTVACLEVGNFVLADARRFETQLEALELGDRQSRRNVPGQEVSSYIVNIPPLASREAANRKAAELRAKGIENLYVIPDNQPLRLAISLGVFKQEAAAQAQLAALVKQGVTGARITPRYAPSKQIVFQFRDIGSETRSRIEALVAKLDGKELRKCQ